jgi:3-deoxy-D-manno-octulosonic-acid transferase
MIPWRGLYTLLLYLLVPFILVRLWWRGRRQPGYRIHIGERFGFYRQSTNKPVLWIHSVSVGETRAAEPLVRALRERWPAHQIVFTHMTPTGRETGEQVFGASVVRCYLPYDLPASVVRFLRHFRPVMGVLLETELWPNLVHACRRESVPLYLVNARMSERSARGYAHLRAFTAQTLQQLAGIAAQTQADAQRLVALGGRDVRVYGNLKFDRSPPSEDLSLGARFRAQLGKRPVFLAASTREDEEELVLQAVEPIAQAELLTIIVPRHPQRFATVARLLEQRGIAYQRRSEDRAVAAHTRVWLGDSLGEMFAYYAACDVAFVGGSLLPLGGQNLLEACAVGKPVVVGPHTFNFAEATELAVNAGAALQVQDVNGLSRVLDELLRNSNKRSAMGQAGKAFMLQHQGAAQRIVAMLNERQLPERSA